MRWTWLVVVLLLAACRQPPAGPPERIAVPRIEYGTSIEDALRVLEDAGLRGHEPDVDWPHYVTGTDPEAGAVVPVGTEVELETGDG